MLLTMQGLEKDDVMKFIKISVLLRSADLVHQSSPEESMESAVGCQGVLPSLAIQCSMEDDVC